MEKFTLINKAMSRIKVFEPFEDSSKNSSIIDAILICYGCVFMRSRRPVMKDSRLNVSNKRETNIKTKKGRIGKKYRFNSFFK